MLETHPIHGYLVQIESAPGIIAEVQINAPTMLDAKMSAGHVMYEVQRFPSTSEAVLANT